MIPQKFIDALKNERIPKYFLLKLEFATRIYYFAETNVQVKYTDRTTQQTQNLFFQAGMLLQNTPEEVIDVVQSQGQLMSIDISIVGTFNIQDTRQTVPLTSGKGELSLWIEGLDYADRYVVLKGRVRTPSWGEEFETFDFTLEESFDSADAKFPPVKIDSDNFPYAADGVIGMPYPVIYGEKKTSLCYMIEDGDKKYSTKSKNDQSRRTFKLCVAGHNVKEVIDLYKDDLTAPVTKGFNGADGAGWGSNTLELDSNNNELYTIIAIRRNNPDANTYGSEDEDPDYFTASNKFSVHVKGKEYKGKLIDNFGGMIEDMILNYTNLKDDEIDWSSLGYVKAYFKNWKCASVFNGSGNSEGKTLQTLQERILTQLPCIMIYKNGKISFVITDYRHISPIMHLEKNINVYQRTSKIQETDINNVYNSFEIAYGYDYRFDDFTKLKIKNPNNDRRCSRSYMKFGLRERDVFQAPDIDDDFTADYLANYIVDLFSNVALTVSYECHPEVGALREGDMVTLTDHDVGFDKKKFAIESINNKLASVEVKLRSIELF